MNIREVGFDELTSFFFGIWQCDQTGRRDKVADTRRIKKHGLQRSGPCFFFIDNMYLLDFDLALFHELRGFEDLQVEFVVEFFQLRVQHVVTDPLCQGEGTEG